MRMSDVLRQLRQQDDRRRAAAAHGPLRGVPASDRGHAEHLARRGLHAAGPRQEPGPAIGIPLLHLKLEGAEPDGLVQGPGHGPRRCQGTRGRVARHRVRVDRQHRRVRGRIWRGQSGDVVVLPNGQIAAGKLLQAQMAGARVVAVDGNFDQALDAVRNLVDDDEAPDRLTWSTRSIRTGWPARRRRHSRFARTWAARPTTWRSPSATRATSLRTGRASPTIATQAWSRPGRRCSASRRRVPRRSSSAMP